MPERLEPKATIAEPSPRPGGVDQDPDGDLVADRLCARPVALADPELEARDRDLPLGVGDLGAVLLPDGELERQDDLPAHIADGERALRLVGIAARVRQLLAREAGGGPLLGGEDCEERSVVSRSWCPVVTLAVAISTATRLAARSSGSNAISAVKSWNSPATGWPRW